MQDLPESDSESESDSGSGESMSDEQIDELMSEAANEED